MTYPTLKNYIIKTRIHGKKNIKTAIHLPLLNVLNLQLKNIIIKKNLMPFCVIHQKLSN